MTVYEVRALNWAETYGIVSYKVNGCKMIYNISYPAYLSNKAYTVQHIVDLRTMQESTRRLNRVDKSAYINRH